MYNTSERAEYKQPNIAVRTVIPCIVCQSSGGAGGHGEQGGGEPIDDEP